MFALRRYSPLYPVLGILGACAQAMSLGSACNSTVYCSGELLHRVQLARIFPDSKTFVDLKMLRPSNETLADFAKLMHHTAHNPSPEQLRDFVRAYFSEGDELEPWTPPDFDPDPPFLKKIVDPALREFAGDVVGIWAKLGRRVSADVRDHPDRYSFLYVPNGFVVPGGRFKESYYWDSYWIVRGLLICDMTQTARGMIENLLHLVNELGYVPNGGRVYYLGRSQPPLLAATVAEYLAATGDREWLGRVVDTVEKELSHWLERRTVTVEVGGARYVLLRYLADAGGPRPESYMEDYTSARAFPSPERREEFYREMRSGAESGWDFSSRWFATADDEEVGDLTSVHVSRILPVDLNAFFARALQLAGDFRALLKDRRRAHKWWNLARYWRAAVEAVLWDEVDGVWYDYDALARAPRRHFYPSCATPLWAGLVDADAAAERAGRLVDYLRASGVADFPGGVPASLLHSGEQWDFPNAWPPLQSVLVGGLAASGNPRARELAREQAELWIRSNYYGYVRWGKMFEKYSAVRPGREGGGGEYAVQDGFGWTNGVLLELLRLYGHEITAHAPAAAPAEPSPDPVVRIL